MSKALPKLKAFGTVLQAFPDVPEAQAHIATFPKNGVKWISSRKECNFFNEHMQAFFMSDLCHCWLKIPNSLKVVEVVGERSLDIAFQLANTVFSIKPCYL